MATGFLWHELFAWYDPGPYLQPYVEPWPLLDTPETKRRIRNLLDVSGMLGHLTPLSPRVAEDDEIARAHDRGYVTRLKHLSDSGGGLVGPFARVVPGGMHTLRLCAGGAMASVDAVLDGVVDNAYALLRPAGHHAEHAAGMGYCLVNNVAIAALHAIEGRGLDRVAIVDWDVHHGNGTQNIFWSDPRVLTISIHQEDLYPIGSGRAEEVGEGDGRGLTVNLPLPAGSGDGAYRLAMESIVVPALEIFRPDLILVSSGLDALIRDPNGRMMLHSDSFRAMTRSVREAAERLCGGRLVLCHEGGYSPVAAPFAGLAILEELSGMRSSTTDPFLDAAIRQPGQFLQQHQRVAVEHALRTLDVLAARRAAAAT